MQVFSIAKGFHYLSKRNRPELTEKERNKQRAVVLLRQIRQPLMVCGLNPSTNLICIEPIHKLDIILIYDIFLL